MEEIEQQNIETEEVTQDQQNMEVGQQEVAAQQEESRQASNFRALRESNERLERERNEAIRRAQELEAVRQPKAQPEPDFSIGDDELVEGKHFKAVANYVKQLEKKIQEQGQRSEHMTAETRIKTAYPDFDKVVNKDTVDLLTDMHPELAKTLNSSTDLYSTGVSAYTMIKQLGIYKPDSYSQEKNLIQQNTAKPRPLTSMSPQQGGTPLTKANAFENGLTEDLKKQLQKEMQDAIKNG